MNRENILQNIEKNNQWFINTRRELHKIPELDFELPKTVAYVTSLLDEMGLTYKTGVGKSGIVVDIEGKNKDITIALRADMDALPILECGNKEYSSTISGHMHACGHDVHTAILLGVAKTISENRDSLPCNVRLLFQPAEETTGGALPMIEDGCLEGVDAIFGLHVDPTIECGVIGIKYGAYCASSTDVIIEVEGKSCHGAYPSQGIDAIVATCGIVTNLQSVISRNIDSRDSAVLSFGKIIGGEKENIVAQNVRVSGTLRTLSPEIKNKVKERVKEMVEFTAKGYGATGKVTYKDSYTALINHDEYIDIVKENGKELLSDSGIYVKTLANMGVEDFAYFVEKVPGAFFNLGVGNKKKGITAPLHNDKFDIDEDSLKIGVALQIFNILSAYDKLNK
ncbi:M20 metallopeptidase family protein [Fusobacterium mortiferum]|uniref:Amidohydrolase n=1 Tax=Fusobacterium mortiferum TaxID=850 RepID=A0ABS2FZN9_FUSMR|nr:M20 family metallopeptidase [Fusobacterium mortiferum]MBM6874616.1 amidohydrolase [Fusobacterium mortiferum]